jgi:hypothetical protein
MAGAATGLADGASPATAAGLELDTDAEFTPTPTTNAVEATIRTAIPRTAAFDRLWLYSTICGQCPDLHKENHNAQISGAWNPDWAGLVRPLEG